MQNTPSLFRLDGKIALVTGAATGIGASIAIGLLLVGVAGWMAHDTSELLIGASARPNERTSLEYAIEEFDEIDKVVELLTMVLGPTKAAGATRDAKAEDIKSGEEALQGNGGGEAPAPERDEESQPREEVAQAEA